MGTTVGGDVEVVVLSSISGGVVSSQSLAVPVLVVFKVTVVLVPESVVGLLAVVSGVPERSS